MGKARQGKVDTSGDAEQVHGRVRAHQERDYEEHLGTQARRCCRVPYGSLGYRRGALGKVLYGTRGYNGVILGYSRVLGAPTACTARGTASAAPSAASRRSCDHAACSSSAPRAARAMQCDVHRTTRIQPHATCARRAAVQKPVEEPPPRLDGSWPSVCAQTPLVRSCIGRGRRVPGVCGPVPAPMWPG